MSDEPNKPAVSTPTAQQPGSVQPPEILIFSSDTVANVDTTARHVEDLLAPAATETPKPDSAKTHALANIAFTLQSNHQHGAARRFLVSRTAEEAATALRVSDPRRTATISNPASAKRPVVFLLPGVGDQYVGMAQDLYDQVPVFRREIDRCAAILQPLINRDVREILYPPTRPRKQPPKSRGVDLKKMLRRGPEEPPDPFAQTLDQTVNCHPALFSVEYALAQVWLDWGVQPGGIICHSMGEYVAACLSGVLSLEDALRLIAARARLVNELPQGSMLAVVSSEEELRPLLGSQIYISLINGPKLCVVAGPTAEMSEFQNQLQQRGVVSRPVRNVHAFHTPMLEPILDVFAKEIAQVRLTPPSIPYTSNVTGTWITKQQALNPAYWIEHARSTARFSDALAHLWKISDCLPLEVGPGRTLGALAMQHPARTAASNPSVHASLRHDYENEPDLDFILNTAGQLWIAGTEIRWNKVQPQTNRVLVPLSDQAVTDQPSLTRTEPTKSLVQSPAEMALSRMWCDTFGIKEIGLDDDFFALGGHSLHAVMLQSRVEKELGFKVPLAAFFQAPTVRQFAQQLSATPASGGQTHLVSPRIAEGQRPVFCFHFLNSARTLAKYIPSEWAICGVETPIYEELKLWHQGQKPSVTMEELASRSLATVRHVQPHGPYILTGWCFGGTLAFEVASQLTRAGEKVELLALLDATYWNGCDRRAAPWLERLTYHGRRLAREGAGYFLTKIKNRIKRSKKRKTAVANVVQRKSAADLTDDERMKMPQELFLNWCQARYYAQPYDGDAVLIRSTTDPSFLLDPGRTNGWERIIQGDLELADLPCGHMDIAREPFVKDVAKWLEEHLAELKSNPAVPLRRDGELAAVK